MNAFDLIIVGLGLSGALWSAGLLLFGWTGPWTDLAAAAALFVLSRKNPGHNTHLSSNQYRVPGFLVAAAGLIVAALFVEHSIRYPEGGWDAVAIWNLRARGLFGAPHDLSRVFTPELPAQHPDYPILLPGLIAHGWFLAGSRTQLVPILISALFAAALVVSLGRRAGWAAALVLLGTPHFLLLSWNQYADLEVAALVLVAVALASDGRLAAAGLAAGLGAFTKNEGLVWLAMLMLAVFATRGRREALRMMAGAAAPIALLAYFKLRWAPPNDLVAQTSARSLLQRAPRRLLLVARGFLWQIADFGKWGLALPAVLVAFVARFRRSTASIFCVLSLAATFGIYLCTPHDPIEHMASSLDRLLFQLWPSIIYAAAASLAPGESPAAASLPSPDSGRA